MGLPCAFIKVHVTPIVAIGSNMYGMSNPKWFGPVKSEEKLIPRAHSFMGFGGSPISRKLSCMSLVAAYCPLQYQLVLLEIMLCTRAISVDFERPLMDESYSGSAMSCARAIEYAGA